MKSRTRKELWKTTLCNSVMAHTFNIKEIDDHHYCTPPDLYSCDIDSHVSVKSILSMMTSWRGSNFRVTGLMWMESTRLREDYPHKGPVTWSFGVSFHICLNIGLNKSWNCRWFKMLWYSLWRHCNEMYGQHLFTLSWITMVLKILLSQISRMWVVCVH